MFADLTKKHTPRKRCAEHGRRPQILATQLGLLGLLASVYSSINCSFLSVQSAPTKNITLYKLVSLYFESWIGLGIGEEQGIIQKN